MRIVVVGLVRRICVLDGISKKSPMHVLCTSVAYFVQWCTLMYIHSLQRRVNNYTNLHMLVNDVTRCGSNIILRMRCFANFWREFYSTRNFYTFRTYMSI